MKAPVPAHEATTAQLGAAYPFVASRRLPVDKVFVGRDLLGGLFVHDPFDLYANGVLTNPNMVVFGQIGRGKSAFVKTYLYRQAAFGRKVVVLDPKGEYAPLATALGVTPISLRPGGPFRINPLDPPAKSSSNYPRDSSTEARALPDGQAAFISRLELVSGLAGASIGRPLTPIEHACIELGLSSLLPRTNCPCLPELVEALLYPDGPRCAEIGLSKSAVAEGGRDVALVLRRMVHGDLAGMFDGPTTPGLNLDGPAVILDLSAVYHSPALPALMACAAAFIQSSYEGDVRAKTVLVIDEAWAVLSNLGIARFIQASWKLARARGMANIAVLHRVSDFSASGAAGSVEARIGDGLIADSETIVCYAQPPSEIAVTSAALGLSAEEASSLAKLRRGVALWRVAGRSYLVEHRIGPMERAMVDTDARLVDSDVATESSISPRPFSESLPSDPISSHRKGEK